MNAFVFQPRDQLQVLDAVVELVSVDMMKFVTRRYWTIAGFPNKYMLELLSPRLGRDAAVSKWCDASLGIRMVDHRMFTSRGFMGSGATPVRSSIAGVPENR